MKHLLRVAGVLVTFLLFSGISTADVFVLEKGLKGGFKKSKDPANAPLTDHGSTNVKISNLYSVPKSEMGIFRIALENQGMIGEHVGPDDPAICYITEGSGEMFNTDGKGNTISTFKFKAGDLIVFHQPMTPHGWKAGPEGCEFLYIYVPPTKTE